MIPSWLAPPLPEFRVINTRQVQHDWGCAEPVKRIEGRGHSPRLNAMYELIRRNPGKTAPELQELTTESVNTMIRNLKRAGRIVANGMHKPYRYYVR